MQTSFADSIKSFFGIHVLLPFEKALLDSLASAMSPTDREILQAQLSKINMSRRLLRHIDEPNAHGFTNFYTVRWGKDVTERAHHRRFKVPPSEGILARCRVDFEGGHIDVEFWQVNGVLFGMKYRSPERIYIPPHPYRIEGVNVVWQGSI
jgi:hypothetical protein